MKESFNDLHEPASGKDNLRNSLIIYLALLVGLWVIGVLAVGIQSQIFHRNYYPFNTLFFQPKLRFTDFTVFYTKLSLFGDPQAFFSSKGGTYTYPAPLLIFNVALFRLGERPLAIYFIGVLLFAALVGVFAFRSIPRKEASGRLAAWAALAAGAFSFPLVFLLDRANLEGIVWIACIVGLYFFVRQRYSIAGALFALAASMKIFPAVLLLLLFARRRYKEFFLSAALIATFTLLALWITGPSIIEAAQGLSKGLDRNRIEVLAFSPVTIGFEHSLFSFPKWISILSTPDIHSYENVIRKMLPVYAFCAVGGFLVIYFARLRRMPVLNQVIVLAALSIMLPYSSYEYTLVHMIGPFVLLVMFLANDVASGRVELEKKQILALLLPFACLFAPMSYFILLIAGFGGQIKALSLVYLVKQCLRVPLPSSLFGELCETASGSQERHLTSVLS
jgi:hypothetical protein